MKTLPATRILYYKRGAKPWKNNETYPDPLKFRLPRDVLDDIEAIASACERTRSWVIVRSLEAYLAAEGGEVLDIARTRAELANGGGVDGDELVAEIEALAKARAA